MLAIAVFFFCMPANTVMFITMAVLGLVEMLIALRRTWYFLTQARRDD
jgi:hypothetical protein